MMHLYRFVRCKTPNCLCKWYVAYQELPAINVLTHYPDEWFPIEVQCTRCQQKSQYVMSDLQSETSHRRLHPQGWQPLLPDAPSPGSTN